MRFVIGAVALAFVIGRLFITPRLATVPSVEGAYEAAAHIFVGFLVLVALYDRRQVLGPSRLYGLIGLAITAWEGALFFIQRGLQ